MGLKLIAIKVDKDTDKKISKVLKNDKFFFFDDSYKYDEKKENIIKDTSKLSYKDFFYCNEETSSSLTDINISAVVGKNGEGKSSIIDVFLAFLNNFNYFFLEKDRHNLLFISKVYGELYFSLHENEEENIFKLKFERNKSNNSISLFCYNELIYKVFYDDMGEIDARKKYFKSPNFKFSKFIFFTLGINYSIYAWNSLNPNYRVLINKKNVSWIEKIFHKNDGYYVPMSLHPYRDKGQIDINKELYLANQRLLSLAITEIRNDEYFKLNANQEFNSLKLSSNLNNRKLTNILNEVLTFKNDISLSYKLDDNELLKIYDYVIDNLHELEAIRFRHHVQLEIGQLEINLHNRFTPISDLFDFDVDEPHIKNTFQRINIRSLYLLIIVNEVKFLFNKIINQYDLNTFINTDSDVYRKLLDYLIYKVISISRTYPKYKNRLFTSIDFHLLDYGFDRSLKKINSYVNELLNDNSHITLKLFQTLNFLTNFRKIENYENYTKLFKHFIDEGNLFIDLKKYNSFYDKINYNNLEINRERVRMEFLPPTIFKPRLSLYDEGDGTHTHFDDLSSGQIQMINTVGTILYHLKNIDSVNVDAYHHVNLILDEIELYFHPEYQRTFISNLLESLKRTIFQNIRSINMVFITHSPFILTDIPKDKVLLLKEGKQVYAMEEDTFGANIHTLLQHGFFLDSVPIGDFAKGKINEYFAILHSGKTELFPEEDLFPYITKVGEPFIKSQLLKLYHEIKGRDNFNLEQKIKSLQEQLEELKSKL